jgi:hypothetical protein
MMLYFRIWKVKNYSKEPLDALNPSCYDKGDDMVDNIDEFIHVGRCK